MVTCCPPEAKWKNTRKTPHDIDVMPVMKPTRPAMLYVNAPEGDIGAGSDGA